MRERITDSETFSHTGLCRKSTSYYPWQQSLWQKLFSANVSSGHFPHAVLLSGVSGIGKKELAFYLTKALLCSSPEINPKTHQVEPDNRCRSCQLFSAGNHPDFYHLTIPDSKKVIPVDAVRDLIQWSVLNSQLGGRKIIIVDPAEAMNLNASNSLLKTLEEPAENTIIILLTNKKQALLPTIRSRCQTFDLPLPASDYALKWLQLQDIEQAKLMLSLTSGAPLFALKLAQSEQLEIRNTIITKFLSIHNELSDPVKVAEELAKQSSSGKNKNKSKKNQLLFTAYDVLYWIDSIVIDLVRLAQGCIENDINNIDHYQNLQQLSNRLYLKKLLQLSDLITKAYYEIQGQVNVNQIFEMLFIDWKNCKK